MSNYFTPGGAALSSNREDWETPQALFDKLNYTYRFTLDPCATSQNAKCAKYYTKEDNGLTKSWEGERVFCNPPYGRKIGDWVAKCFNERNNAELIVMLIPARTDTRYFHEYILPYAEISFIRGRLKFELGGGSKRPGAIPQYDSYI